MGSHPHDELLFLDIQFRDGDNVESCDEECESMSVNVIMTKNVSQCQSMSLFSVCSSSSSIINSNSRDNDDTQWNMGNSETFKYLNVDGCNTTGCTFIKVKVQAYWSLSNTNRPPVEVSNYRALTRLKSARSRMPMCKCQL